MTVTKKDKRIVKLAARTNHRKLGIWAADCAERVLPYFEKRRPKDNRPRKAIETLWAWVKTKKFRMADIRGAALAAHAAARGIEEYSPARSAARAAGQAVATAHVARHAIGAAVYATTAVSDAANPMNAEAAALEEREWQYRHLLSVRRTPERRCSLK